MDHFRGLLTVFKEYSGAINEFWRPPYGQADWSALFASFTEELEKEPTEERKDRIAERIKLFRRLIDSALAEKKHGMRSYIMQDMREMLKEEVHKFSITCLGPSTDIIDGYFRTLARNVIKKESHTEIAPHNLVSSVVAVKYGNWIGLLGGDTEKRSWNYILDRCEHDWVSGARLVKVSHHGSETGSYDRLWRSIKSEDCDAVVTCFAAQELPSKEGLRPIKERGFSIYSTNSELASQLSRDKTRANAIYFPPSFNAESGEVLITVDNEGNSTVSFFDAAGLIK